MLRSISEPSLGTVGTETLGTTATSRAGSRHNLHKTKQEHIRGKFLWEGHIGRITRIVLLTPWNMWFQVTVVLAVIAEFVIHLLLAYYFNKMWSEFAIIIILAELIFFADVLVHLVHMFWPLVRLHMRVHRRSLLLLFYDVISLIPLVIVFGYKETHYEWLMLGRWLGIGRIYRFFTFFEGIKEHMRTSRKTLYLIEHMVTVLLILHASTCLWYALHEFSRPITLLYGYPEKIASRRLKFHSYMTCWYYCACRLYNVIFGDAFPMYDLDKWLTSVLMLFGYVFMRYRFIGTLSWELVLENSRRAVFVDRYHHMVNYLTFRGVQPWLLDQAKKYKEMLWEMKDGILTSKQFQKLPQPLQMELIFDINVGYFHSSLLFRDTHESFMRQISLLMKHEIYLAGQQIWSQGVVKSGMMCVKRGIIEMLSDEDDESPMIAFKENTILGELSLFYSIPSKVTVKAATYVELQILRRTDFMRVISEYPSMLQHIRSKIYERLAKSQRRQESIMKYDKGDSRLIRTRYRPMKVLKDNLVGVEEEDPTFVDDSHMYYKDENNVRLPKFTTEYLELYEVTSNVTTIDAPTICLRSNFPWILEPNTDFTYMCELGHFLMVLYICAMSPYTAITNRQFEAEKIFGTIVTAGLLLNLYVQLTTAIVDKNVRKETVKEIAEVKMSTFGFYLDIISLFPVYIFTDTLDPNGETVAGQVAKLFPVLQVWHIWDYFVKWEKNFNSHVKLLSLLKFFILFCVFCYWSGCFLFLFACPRTLCRENSWMSLLIYWETKVFMTNDAKHEHPMMSSFAFGTSVFTGTGTSDIAPGVTDLVVVVLLFTLGTYLSCYYTAKICSLYLLSTQRKLKFKESMRELFYFLSVNHVSGKIKSRVKKFFCVQWYYNNAVSSEEIFKDMSANIQQEVLSIEMVETLLHCPLFQDCNRDFLQTVAANTRTIVLPDNEIVQHAADIGRDMYILQKGHCNVLNNTGKVVTTIGPGSHFGVVEMLFGLPKVHTVLTSTNCILLHVEYTTLMQCWGTFPDICHPIITVLEDEELLTKAGHYEEAKPLTGRMDVKTNRIAQEIKESFVVLNSSEQRKHYVKAFEKLGVMRHLRYMFLPISITPHGLFLKFWCTLRFLMAIFYVLSVPYDIATKQHEHGRSYNWPDIFLYVDIVIMAYVAYYNERSLLVTHPLLTTTRYFKHSFLYDVISIFPFEQLVRIVNDNTDLDMYRMNRMLLVTRITGAFSFWESDIMQLNPIVVLLKFLPIAVTLVNFATAIFFINTCVPYLPNDSYYILVNCTKVLVVSNSRYEVKYAATEYAHTFYWVYEIFVGVGCTPMGLANSVDVWLMMALQIAGFLYFAFMVGYVSSTRSAAAHALLEHTTYDIVKVAGSRWMQAVSKSLIWGNLWGGLCSAVDVVSRLAVDNDAIKNYEEKTRDLENFLYQENVDPILTSKTLKYFEYVWKRTNGSNPQLICRRLNSALMEDTLVFMYERALREVPLFGKVERSFIRVVTQHLNEMYFLKGDTVIQCKDIQPYIYIIYRGKVDVLTSYNEMITCMGPGGMFGNFTGLPISCSEVTIYASRSLDLLVISSQTFLNLVKYYPKVQEPLSKAFEISRDYILPITMDFNDETSYEDSEVDIRSLESAIDSRSGSSRFELTGQLSLQSSQSNMSQAKSSASVMTYQSYTNASNLLRPGTLLFQTFGYVTCILAAANYATCLYEMVTLNDCYLIFWIQAAFDIFFYIKICLSMHKSYISKHGELIMDAAKCRKRYFKHKIWVWTDVLVALPLELFSLCSSNPVRLMHYLRANKLFRLKYLFEFYRQTSAELTNNLTTLQCAMTMIVVILLIHTFTCIWLVTLMATAPINIIRTLKIHLVDEETPQHRWDYTTSFYVVVSVLTTTGGDEFVIDELLPMAILAVILICGKMLAAIVVASSTQVAYSTKYALNAYEKVTKELIDMLKNQGLSDYQLDKFWKYVKQLWVTERGRQLPALLEQTPYVRRCDLMSAMFGQHLRNCYLFADTGEPFLRQLTAALDFAIYFPGNYIVVAGESEARMHWVNSGTVSVVSVRDDLTETTHELLGPGNVFGILQGLNRGVMHNFSYRAETKVTILSLSLDTWDHITTFFPEAKKIISERAEEMFSKI